MSRGCRGGRRGRELMRAADGAQCGSARVRASCAPTPRSQRARARRAPESARVLESERDDAIGALVRTGLVDDVRYAESRARQLAGRGAGDALIRHTLARAGVEAEVAAEALLTVAPEAERARSVVERRGAQAKTARYLLGKGFSEETVSAVIASESAGELG